MKKNLNGIKKHLCAISVGTSMIAGGFGCAKSASDPTATVSPTPAVTTAPTADPTPAPTAAAALPQPGAIMLALDDTMGSIGFAGQKTTALALDGQDYDPNWTTDAWKLAHCKPVGGGVLDNQTRPDMWGCRLSVATDGPDTPRGGTARIKSISCSIDEAIAAGVFAIDGEPHTFKMPINVACWGQQFVDMAVEYLPDQVNAATGLVEVDTTVTGYKTIPSTMSSVPTKWEVAYKVAQALGTEVVSDYTMLLHKGDDGIAASVYRKDSDRTEAEIFAMSIKYLEDDVAEFRYEGRFPYALHGDGKSYGSSHTRVVVSGPYTDGEFTAISSGSGYEAMMNGASIQNDSETPLPAITSGSVNSFKADSHGIGTKDINVNADGSIALNNEGHDWNGAAGTTSPNDYTYTATAAEKSVFLTTEVGAFTSSADWHKANGPLDFETAEIAE